ncbi:MAG: VOC family protein [Armatimonadetes bacterium]|nr:VOC family protein [Armatimonadota bacterium]
MPKDVRFDHVAVAVHSVEGALPLFRDLLGGVFREEGNEPRYRWYQLQFPGGVVELLEPRGLDDFLHRFLAQHGEGLHHLTFTVKNLREWADRLRAAGHRVVGENYSDPNWQEVFLHPRGAHGVLIQLAETLEPLE